jgi:hypothetical protein
MRALLLFVPLLVAPLPLFTPWRWFAWSALAVAAIEGVVFALAAGSLEGEAGHGGDGPATLGMAIYFGAVCFLYGSAVALRLAAKAVTWLLTELRVLRSLPSIGAPPMPRRTPTPNPSIEGTASSGLRPPPAAPHVKR